MGLQVSKLTLNTFCCCCCCSIFKQSRANLLTLPNIYQEIIRSLLFHDKHVFERHVFFLSSSFNEKIEGIVVTFAFLFNSSVLLVLIL